MRHGIEGGFAMIHDCKTRLAARLLFLVAAAATTPAAAAAFDGSWNVSIVTRTGSCESGASLPIRISNGRIESGAAPVSVSGRVGESGGIVVAVSSGYKSATGSGRLASTAGSGTWHGGMCSGTWTAQRK
jgi:hypothetical protein